MIAHRVDERPRSLAPNRKASRARQEVGGLYHAKAMAVANEQTVLGNFNDATFDYFGVVSRFYRKDGGFWVRTEGPDGSPVDYQVSFVFGVWPLQQYLIQFPGGRLQSLTISWDDVKKQWYYMYPAERIMPND
jgi:hypothetical protein